MPLIQSNYLQPLPLSSPAAPLPLLLPAAPPPFPLPAPPLLLPGDDVCCCPTAKPRPFRSRDTSTRSVDGLANRQQCAIVTG